MLETYPSALSRARVLAPSQVGPAIRNVVVEDGYYGDHHIEMLKNIGASPKWTPLYDLAEWSRGTDGAEQATEASGAAAEHSHAARYEAARKLIMSHEAVARDVTNQAPMTQKELKRVAAEHKDHVDQALRELARRLIGNRPGAE